MGELSATGERGRTRYESFGLSSHCMLQFPIVLIFSAE